MSHTRCCRTVAIAVALLVGIPDAAFAASGTAASKSMDRMSPQELDRFVQQLNENANWRKYRRPNDPPGFVPGKPVKVMHGAGSSFGRSGGGGGGSGGFRKSGLANRRGARAGRGKNRDDAMAQGRGSSRSGRSGLGSGSGSRSSSSSGSSSRSRSNTGFGSSSRNSGSSFGNSNGGGGLGQ
ncbi:MAG: hypothetical protein NTZ61_11730 [Proteobacteria bacterium]|nr:hypothetical protein [Pseudomonadota bacterium]